MNKKAKAVVLGCSYTGYGVIRSLAESGLQMPIVCFEKELFRPEAKTRLATVRSFKNEDDLLKKLLDLSKREVDTPVLFLTSDWFVDFFQKSRVELTQTYNIDTPSNEVITTLFKKDAFSLFAEKNGFKIPYTLIIDITDFERKMNCDIDFPCVIKPLWRDDKWKKEGFPKIFIYKKKSDLINDELRKIFKVQERLIVQEWIPGNDKQIYFSLVYYNSESKNLAEFSGRKIRQYPVGTGSTSCAEPVDVVAVKKETIRFFNTIKYSGFGSIEYKRHEETGEFFIMEPTVGRSDHQSYIATINGINFPAISYCNLSGVTLPVRAATPRRTLWIDDQFDLFSMLHTCRKGELKIKDIFQLLTQRKKFRFFNLKDMRPFLFAVARGVNIIGKTMFKK